MANADKPAPAPVPQTPETADASATPESRREVGRRNLNRQIAQRQKALLAGVGAIALIGGAAFLFSGDDDRRAGASGDTVNIDTGGLVNRNLSEREFVATYGNRADAQDREIKALKEGQVSRPELEQQLAGAQRREVEAAADARRAPHPATDACRRRLDVIQGHPRGCNVHH